VDEPELTRRLDTLQRPAVSAEALKAQLRLTLVSVRTSSRLGAGLIALPGLFLFGVILHYGFGLPVPGFATLEGALTSLEQQRYGVLLTALILVGAPLLALTLNLLALIHVQVDRGRRELQITLRLRPLSLIVALLAALIVALVAMHVIAERAHHLC
jgi:hypothetical protein